MFCERTLPVPLPTATPSPFFRLPAEIRLEIYGYCLVEKPRWQKRHKSACPYASKNDETLERPPFLAPDGTFAVPRRSDSCTCARREGLSLLAANRQIHAEAAPVFWSGNAFFFAPATQFAKDVGVTLRPAYRGMIRHVRLICDGMDADTSTFLRRTFITGTYTGADAWRTIRECTGLRTLEMHHPLVNGNEHAIPDLLKTLPHLQTFRLLTMMAFKLWPITSPVAVLSPTSRSPDNTTSSSPCSRNAVRLIGLVPGRSAPAAPGSVLWCMSGQTLDLSAIQAPMALWHMLREFGTNFLVHLHHKMTHMPDDWPRPVGKRRKQQHPEESDSESFWTPPPVPSLPSSFSLWSMTAMPWHYPTGLPWHSPTPPGHLVPKHWREGPLTTVQRLRDGTTCAIEMIGLPIRPMSRSARGQLAQARIKEAAARRRAGEKTAEEVARAKAVAAQQCKKRADERLRQRLKEAIALRVKQKARQASRQQAEAAAQQAAVAQQQAQAQACREASQARQAERKRVALDSAVETEWWCKWKKRRGEETAYNDGQGEYPFAAKAEEKQRRHVQWQKQKATAKERRRAKKAQAAKRRRRRRVKSVGVGDQDGRREG